MTYLHLPGPLVPVTLTLVALAVGDPQSAPSVLRFHDLKAAAPVADENGSAGPGLLPLSTDVSMNEPETTQGQTVRQVEFVVDLLRAMYSARWESDGRELSPQGDTRILVRAPVADQESIARQLAFFEESLGRPTRLVFDFATFSPNPGVENLSTVIPAGDVQRWVDVALGHERHELSILPGERQGVVAERSVTLSTNYELEVACHAAAYAATTERIQVGTRIDTAVAPTRGGLWLALNLREGRLLGNVEPREQSLTATIATEQGVRPNEGPRTRDDVRLANHSMSVNSFLPDGKALVFQTNVGLETHVVFVHQEGGPTPVTYRLPDDLKRAVPAPETMFFRVDSLAPPVAALPTNGVSAGELGGRFAGIESGGMSILATSMEMERTNEVLDLLGVGWSESGPTETLRTNTWWVPVCTSREASDAQVTTITQLSTAPRALQMKYTLRKGTRDATVLARGLLPVRAAASSTLVLGKESLATSRTGLEIADSASAPTPVVSRLFDGMVVEVSPDATAGGGLSLKVDAHARWSREAPRTFDAGTTMFPKLQLQDSDVLDSSRTLVFAKSETGARRIVLGNAGTANDALTLEIEIVDLP